MWFRPTYVSLSNDGHKSVMFQNRRDLLSLLGIGCSCGCNGQILFSTSSSYSTFNLLSSGFSKFFIKEFSLTHSPKLANPAKHLWTSMTQSRSFAIVDPSNWNKLPQSLRDLYPISSDQFRKHLKTSLFVIEDTDPGRERLWFKWRYINVCYNYS